MPKPRQGSEVKEHQSIRLEPKIKEELKKKFGSVQAGIDFALNTIIQPERSVNALHSNKSGQDND